MANTDKTKENDLNNAPEKVDETPKETKKAENDVDKKVLKAPKRRVPFAIVESYKNLRTSITFLLSECDGNSFAVTSANAGEGKSTTSSNLAIAFSQLGKKVLLIDADLRRASLHKKFQIDNSKGLSDIISSDLPFEEAFVAINPVLHVLTAGTLPPNPSELLDSQKFSDLMTYLNSVYDYVIVDTPPLNVVSDSLIVAPNTAGMVLVVRDGYTPHYSIKKAIEVMNFANVNILGSIMNGTNPKSKSRYVYRKSSYDTSYYGNKRDIYGGRKGYRNGYGYGGYGYGGYGYGDYGRRGVYGGYDTGYYGPSGRNYEPPREYINDDKD